MQDFRTADGRDQQMDISEFQEIVEVKRVARLESLVHEYKSIGDTYLLKVRFAMLRFALLCPAMLCYDQAAGGLFCYALLHDVVLCYIPYCIVLYGIVLYCFVLYLCILYCTRCI